MNKIVAITLIAFSSIISLVSCKSSSNQDIVNNAVNNTISASINDSSFSASNTSVYAGFIDTSSLSLVYLSATSNGSQIVIELGNYSSSTNKYSVGSGSLQASISLLYMGVSQMATTGTILISSATASSVSGTFLCTFPNTTQITNGKFNAIW